MKKETQKSKMNLFKLINHLIAIKKLNNYPHNSSNLELETDQNQELENLLQKFHLLVNPNINFSISSLILSDLANKILKCILIEFFRAENYNIVYNMRNYKGCTHFLNSVVNKNEIHFDDRFYRTESLDCFIQLLGTNNILEKNEIYNFVSLHEIESLLNHKIKSQIADLLKSAIEKPSTKKIKADEENFSEIRIK
jgi:hypothetical protein